MFPRTTARRAFAMLATSLLFFGCADRTSGPADTPAQLVISASVIGTPVATLVVEVTGPGISVPVLQNIPVTDGRATGTIKMPPGESRRITVRAYESGGQITHQGSLTVDVRPGMNPAVTIPMMSNAGHLPITVQLGSVSITITPSVAAVPLSGTLRLSASIHAPSGEEIDATPEWATSDPSRATVDQNGLVTGLREGSVTIAATYEGIAAASTITVGDTENNAAPVARAGLDREVSIGSAVTLDGGASSDEDGDALTLTWTQTGGTDVTGGHGTLSGASPTFTAPAGISTLTFSLVAHDGTVPSVADEVVITVVPVAGRSIFVTVDGNNLGAGTPSAPLRTIAAGLARAAARGAGTTVYLGLGTFSEGTVALVSGVNISGGYGPDWDRAPGSRTVIRGEQTGMLGSSVTAVTISNVDIQSLDAVSPSGSSYGVRLVNSSGVTFVDARISAGRGAPGVAGASAGANGTSGGAGSPGFAGCDGCSANGGGGIGASGARPGGNGGGGGFSASAVFTGAPGGFGGGVGGNGGAASTSCGTVAGSGFNGARGVNGVAGVNGTGGASFGLPSGGMYLPANAGPGSGGYPAYGGGGGGGGGGGPEMIFFCSADRGGGGGGGGAGGMGGGGGSAGPGGGGSFGIFAMNTTGLIVRSSQIETAGGGAGGAGRAGGLGGLGGLGGAGGLGRDNSGNGGRGGDGGVGGNGGAGGGGGGGPSIGIYHSISTAPVVESVNFSIGAPGLGGTSPVNPGAIGRTGNVGF